MTIILVMNTELFKHFSMFKHCTNSGHEHDTFQRGTTQTTSAGQTSNRSSQRASEPLPGRRAKKNNAKHLISVTVIPRRRRSGKKKWKSAVLKPAGCLARQVTGSGLLRPGFCANDTLNVFIPGLPVGQVHVDVGTQRRGVAAENTVNFVLVKSSFL